MHMLFRLEKIKDILSKCSEIWNAIKDITEKDSEAEAIHNDKNL